MSKYGVIFDPNKGKYGPEVTPYLDTFNVVSLKGEVIWVLTNIFIVCGSNE